MRMLKFIWSSLEKLGEIRYNNYKKKFYSKMY